MYIAHHHSNPRLRYGPRNVLSGAGFIINSGWNGAYPSAFVNVIWMSSASMASSWALECVPVRQPKARSSALCGTDDDGIWLVARCSGWSLDGGCRWLPE